MKYILLIGFWFVVIIYGIFIELPFILLFKKNTKFGLEVIRLLALMDDNEEK